MVDGCVDRSTQKQVSVFSRVVWDDNCLQDKQPIYLMLHKPKGVVSATKDGKHTTVLDLIDHPEKRSAHRRPIRL